MAAASGVSRYPVLGEAVYGGRSVKQLWVEVTAGSQDEALDVAMNNRRANAYLNGDGRADVVFTVYGHPTY